MEQSNRKAFDEEAFDVAARKKRKEISIFYHLVGKKKKKKSELLNQFSSAGTLRE